MMMKRAAIASGHRAVTEAASELLRAGGNAFDAAVGAAFASTLAEPALSSLGGGGFLLARPVAGNALLFDFFTAEPADAGAHPPERKSITVRFPDATQSFECGASSVAVPGMLKGLLHVHERLGQLPLREVTAPARELAQSGVEWSAFQTRLLGLLEPIVTLTAEGRRRFTPGGCLAQPGQRSVNHELAAFLDALPDSSRDFYEGPLARALVRELRAAGGSLSQADLSGYRVIERPPLALRTRNAQVLTNPAPALGGRLLALGLRQLAQSAHTSDAQGDAVATALARVEALREMNRQQQAGLPAEETGNAEATDGDGAPELPPPRAALRGTTHISVCDAEGNAAALTLSNGEGSGHFAPGVGIMLNNMLGEEGLQPAGPARAVAGRRLASMMAPSLLIARDGAALALGSGGSNRIPAALLQVLCHLLDAGQPLDAAVEAPRLFWDGAKVQAEPGFEDAVLAALRARFPLSVWRARDMYFGGVHAATGDAAVADSRRDGAAGLEPR